MTETAPATRRPLWRTATHEGFVVDHIPARVAAREVRSMIDHILRVNRLVGCCEIPVRVEISYLDLCCMADEIYRRLEAIYHHNLVVPERPPGGPQWR